MKSRVRVPAWIFKKAAAFINSKEQFEEKKIIGVLGGMGPEATAEFYRLMVVKAQCFFSAQYDADFPATYIYSAPIPDIVEGLDDNTKRTTAERALVEAIQKIASWKPDFIVIPCNSAYVFFPEMQRAISIPILQIAEEVSLECQRKKYQKVGLLATSTTVKNRIYQDKIDLVLPNETEQKVITQSILNILSGKKSIEDKKELEKVICSLKTQGAEAIILGCTELPLLLQGQSQGLELLNTIEILAEATIKKAYNLRTT